jgi:hypothetical protein
MNILGKLIIGGAVDKGVLLKPILIKLLKTI